MPSSSLAHQSEPLPWLCGWALLSSQRNEHLQLDSLMHLYWPHQRDDFRSEPTICVSWVGAPGRKELPWSKQQETGCQGMDEREAYSRWGHPQGELQRGEMPLSAWSLPSSDAGGSQYHKELPVSIISLPHPNSPATPHFLLSLNPCLFLDI